MYCGSALSLDIPTYVGPGSERCCLCRRTLGRYTNLKVETTSDGSEICEWCIHFRFEGRQRMPKYSEVLKAAGIPGIPA